MWQLARRWRVFDLPRYFHSSGWHWKNRLPKLPYWILLVIYPSVFKIRFTRLPRSRLLFCILAHHYCYSTCSFTKRCECMSVYLFRLSLDGSRYSFLLLLFIFQSLFTSGFDFFTRLLTAIFLLSAVALTGAIVFSVIVLRCWGRFAVEFEPTPGGFSEIWDRCCYHKIHQHWLVN